MWHALTSWAAHVAYLPSSSRTLVPAALLRAPEFWYSWFCADALLYDVC